MELKTLAAEIHNVNKEKGFWDNPLERNVGELLMLCVTELSEAMEAHRKGYMHEIEEIDKQKGHALEVEEYKSWFESKVKNSFEDEIADTVIRLLDLSEGLHLDLLWHIRAKIKYNKMRAFKHGKAY